MLVLQRVDLRNARQISLDPPLVRRTKQLAGKRNGHRSGQQNVT